MLVYVFNFYCVYVHPACGCQIEINCVCVKSCILVHTWLHFGYTHHRPTWSHFFLYNFRGWARKTTP